MITPILLPITPEINTVCTLIEKGLVRFLQQRDTIKSWGRYEAQNEAHIILVYCLQGIQSTLLLARQDLAFLPSAVSIVRTVLDGSIRILWMLKSEDLYECEARWLAIANDKTGYFNKMANLFADVDASYAEKCRKNAEQSQQFYSDVKSALEQLYPSKYTFRTQEPDVRAMLREVGNETDYWKFMWGSQFTHITTVVTGLYRTDGSEKMFSEFVQSKDWSTCFDVMWSFFEQAAHLFFERYGADPEQFFTQEQRDELRLAIESIR